MPQGIKPYNYADADRRLIPFSIADQRAIAFLQLVWGLLHFDTKRIEIYRIDTIQSDVIPHLMQQFRLEKFLPDNLPEDRRRALLKRAIEIWRYIGTRHGIKLVVEISLNIKISFVEWWEYDGTPHTFVVALSIDRSQQTYLNDLGVALQNRVITLVEASKPARSKLLRLDLALEVEARVNLGAIVDDLILIMDLMVAPNEDATANLGLAIAVDTIFVVLD
jgi:phage tail P2-like protein